MRADHEADLAATTALLDAQLKLQSAQDGYAAAVARSNAEVLAAKQRSVSTSQAELAQIAQRIAQAQQEGKTQAEISGLTSDYVQKQTSIYEQQKGIRTYLTGWTGRAWICSKPRRKARPRSPVPVATAPKPSSSTWTPPARNSLSISSSSTMPAKTC